MNFTSRFLTALALVGAAGIAGVARQAQPAPASPAPQAVKSPAVPLHKELERHRMAVADKIAAFTVSVEIDYSRADSRPVIPIPGLPGADADDPFFRYDIGPFSGLIVSPTQVLISDRCLGDFNAQGAAPTVQRITVTLPNGERLPAKVVGRHQQIDLALLEVQTDVTRACPGLAVAVLPTGESKLQRGQHILVVGRGQNPLGRLVNDGVVSAQVRERGRAFQFDARIGNSTLGAPVADNHGNLVGVVTLHNHRSFGQASGVSYAAYVHEVRQAFEVLKEGKFLPRPPLPFMGVGAQKKWTDRPGLEVGTVSPGSGAEKAGLRIGDVILSVDGTDMNDVVDLQVFIAKKKVGDTIDVKILREEAELAIKVTLQRAP